MVTVSKEATPLEHSALKLTISVGKDDVRSQYDETLSEYSKSLQIPGFRKGKVPKNVLELKLGDALKEDVIGRIVEKSLTSIFEDESFPLENHPLPYSTPHVEEKPVLNLDSDFAYYVVYDVFPKFTLGQWKGLEVEVPDVRIADEDITRELDALRERNAVVQDREEGTPASQNDVATVNFSELSDAGEVLVGTEREEFVFTIGTGRNVFKFDDDIIGMKKGETKDFEKTYPTNFEDEELAGKTKKLRVTLSALKEKKLPELDDEFAQDVDEKFKTIADLKANAKEQLEKNLELGLRTAKTNRILEKIMESTPVDLPESMIRFQIEAEWRRITRGMEFPDDPQRIANIVESLKPDTLKTLHSRIIVESIIKELGLDASDEEIEQQIIAAAEESGEPLEAIKEYYEKEGMKEMLKDDIRERKLCDLLLTENKVKIGPAQTYQEFFSSTGYR
jgi:trigger factor